MYIDVILKNGYYINLVTFAWLPSGQSKHDVSQLYVNSLS